MQLLYNMLYIGTLQILKSLTYTDTDLFHKQEQKHWFEFIVPFQAAIKPEC